MKYTNNAQLPAALVSALIHDGYDYSDAGDLSATSAILPPRIRQLTKRHSDEITEDVSERVWRVIGDIGHGIVERAKADNVFREERLSVVIGGWKITGKVDLMRQAGDTYAIDDYKFTSVWAAKDEKPEWTQQLNIYALLARANGFDVTELRIVNILRDWSKLRAKREPDYPQVGVVVREVPLWDADYAEGFLAVRVALHQEAANCADDELPLCTPQERWEKPAVFAVKKKGNKRALRLFQDRLEAAAFAAGDLEIEERPAENVRCESYCAVKEFCSFGRMLGQRDVAAGAGGRSLPLNGADGTNPLPDRSSSFLDNQFQQIFSKK